MERILVTGSGGMLGADLWQVLKGRYDLAGLDVAERRGLYGKRFFPCDITDGKVVRGAVRAARPAAVIHAAAWADVDACESDREKAFAINGGGTGNVARACAEADSILIYLSTDYVFDGKKDSPYREDDATRPLSVYGASKLAGEEAVSAALEPHAIVRTSWLFGGHGRNFVDTILDKSRVQGELKVVDDQVGSPTYTVDLAGAIGAFLDIVLGRGGGTSRWPGIYHVSNSGSVSWCGFAREIVRLGKREGVRVEPITSEDLARRAPRPTMSVLDTAKFGGFTGVRMRSWQDAVREYIAGKGTGSSSER